MDQGAEEGRDTLASRQQDLCSSFLSPNPGGAVTLCWSGFLLGRDCPANGIHAPFPPGAAIGRPPSSSAHHAASSHLTGLLKPGRHNSGGGCLVCTCGLVGTARGSSECPCFTNERVDGPMGHMAGEGYLPSSPIPLPFAAASAVSAGTEDQSHSGSTPQVSRCWPGALLQQSGALASPQLGRAIRKWRLSPVISLWPGENCGSPRGAVAWGVYL